MEGREGGRKERRKGGWEGGRGEGRKEGHPDIYFQMPRKYL